MKRLGLLLLALFFLAAGPAAAQEKFPSKPIRIVVAFAPGSATDVTARLLAEQMRTIVGQNVFVDNKPGAFGIVAIEEMARARPDGHTVMIGNVSTSALTPRLYRSRFSIDYEKEVTPVSRISVIPGFLIVSAKLMPAKTLQEFVDWAKQRPGQVRYATTGVGAFTHFEGELFSRRAGIEMVHIPMKEGPPAMVREILSGDIHIASMTMATAQSLLQAGQFRALATSADQRVPEYPDIPTMAEAGYPRIGTPNWSMMFTHAATPEPVLEALHAAVTKALDSEELKAAYKKTLIYPTPSASIGEARSWLKAEMERWDRITKEVKIEIEQ
jgi:tripartite-type tricarboxylate transporter receptor subunit TctC